MRLIPLSRGLFTKVDDDDYCWLILWKWRPIRQHKGKSVFCAMARFKSTKKLIKMHRLLTGALPGQIVDHIDRDPLNNQKSNLRICTNAENMRNCGKRKDTSRVITSKYKGVSLRNIPSSVMTKPWRAWIQLNYKVIHLKGHATEEDAARAYDAAAIKYHGEFACLNFPENDTRADKRTSVA